MTDATTADKLAAWELIERYKLSVSECYPRNWVAHSRHHGTYPVYADTHAAAVRAWAEAAGVPWKPPQVVDQFATLYPDGRCNVYAHRDSADMLARLVKGKSVPCEVVIRTETEGV